MFPAPVYYLLAFAIPAPELAPVLLVAALIVTLIAARSLEGLRVLALFFGLATMGLSAIPVVQFFGTRTAFDAATASLPPVVPLQSFDDVTIVRGITFAEPEGRALTLDVYRPGADRLFPVVVQVYGGAWRSGAPADNSGAASALARHGYVVMAIDYRHAPAAHWPAQIDDVRTAIEWIAGHAGEYGGDAQHMALVGRSSGAQLALIAAYTNPERISAVVSFYGPTNLDEGWRTPPSPDPLPVRPALEAFLGGTPDDVPRLYEAASPVTYVSRRVPPTLLVYGARDDIVEPRFGRELHDRLKAAGATSIYLEIPWAQHAFDLVPGLSARLVDPYVSRFLSAYLH